MRDMDDLFATLEKSKFRSRFQLKQREADYLRQKGMPVILDHARDFITKRLAPANPPNDGRQTPMKNHPVFVAQHATAACCRNCLQKWHRISKGRTLSQKEIDYIITILERWLKNHSSEQ